MKRLLAVAAFALMLSMLGSAIVPTVEPVSANATTNDLSNAELPPDLGQAAFQVFVPETGHTLRGYFLDYWRATGGEHVYGNPISEPFASADGLYSQAFENGVFQFRLELIWTDLPSVTLMNLGTQALDDRLDDFRADGRRGGGGGDRRTSSWKGVAPDGATATRAISEGGVWNENTGNTISGEFYRWYQANEGPYYLGNPISQPLRDRGLLVQYFQGGILMQDNAGALKLAPLGNEMAAEVGIDTSPVDGSGLPVFDESLFYQIGNPNPMGDMATPGKRWIEVNLSEQRLYAYQGDTLISTSLVSTGIEPNHTEQGVFHVRYKLEKTDMAGITDANGQVIALGEAEDNSGGIPYAVKDVPHVMYFNYDAEAFHGAYWHSNFGYRMSHGCVNLPLDFATFLFNWAPLGTMVWVHA
ncbi:MAG: L,D-transpeptidase [Thermomicrobiales bacterium]|nr:L,D-transpeptidase [Thermomicrobiales bacterium]MCO5220515.1 L,D-transpeptidase [Thermomicrobiales bacterium]